MRNTLQPTATTCNTLQHAATRCNALQHAATRYNISRGFAEQLSGALVYSMILSFMT